MTAPKQDARAVRSVIRDRLLDLHPMCLRALAGCGSHSEERAAAAEVADGLVAALESAGYTIGRVSS